MCWHRQSNSSQYKAASAQPRKINNTLFVVDVKYEINEKCPISKKVTFSSNVCLTTDWLYSHLFQFGWVRRKKTELQLSCCLADLHYCKIYTFFIFSECIAWSVKLTCSTDPDKCIKYTFWGFQCCCGILNAYWGTPLLFVTHRNDEKNTHNSHYDFSSLIPRVTKRSTVVWKENSLSLLKMTFYSTSHTRISLRYKTKLCCSSIGWWHKSCGCTGRCFERGEIIRDWQI